MFSKSFFSRQSQFFQGVTKNIHFVLPFLFLLLPLLFLILFYFYPLWAILKLGFAPTGIFDLSSLQELFDTTYYAKILWFTIWQAALSTILTMVIALPGAYVFARYQFPGKSLLKAIVTIPFVLPTVVVATAFSALLGPKGLLNSGLITLFNLDAPPIQLQYSLPLILLAHVFYNYAVVLRLVGNFWSHLDPRLTEAAQLLGASPQKAFIKVTLPLLTPIIGAASLLIYLFCFTSFGVILILGGPRFATLEVEIYNQAVYLFDLPIAAILSLVQIIFMFSLMLIYTRLQNRTSHPLHLQSTQTTQKIPTTWHERLLVWGNIIIMLILLGTPLLTLLIRSLITAKGLSLTYYQALFMETNKGLMFVSPQEAIFNSLIFALATVITATTLGFMVAQALAFNHKRLSKNPIPAIFDAIFMLPLATSAVTLGFGYIITMGKPPYSWVALRTSPILVVIAHTLVALPFVVRVVLPALRAIQPRLREAATILGANPLQVWQKIDWPITRRTLLVGAVFAFTISMGEFGATIFIARPDTPTMPTAIFRFLGQPGALNYGQALAMSTILMGVCAIGFIIIERFRIDDTSDF